MRDGSSREGLVGAGGVRRRRAATAATAALLVLVASCGDDGGDVDPVAAAEARVSAGQESVNEAQARLDDASAAFCEEASGYIAAIDRYGDVFADSATTVGDVKTAGADLERPREAAASSGETVAEAREELASEQQDLAEAEAALAAVRSGTSAAQEATTTTTAPLLPAATVDRVQQAEADLAAASEGITDQTPLTEAGARFNSAAFALEVAWMRLFADAGCLTDEARSQATAALAEYTTALQTSLQTAGYFDGPIDGVYGPATVEAVEALQTEAGLPVTGYVDRATSAALDAKVAAVGGDVAIDAVAHTAAVQSTLKLAGYWTGPVDGIWTPELTEALTAFQTSLRVPPTGAIDVATLSALEQAIADAKTDSTSTTTVPETTTTGTSTTVATTVTTP